MAIPLPQRVPKNASGDFYVEAGKCLRCCLPHGEAPELLNDAKTDFEECFFRRQPETPDEIDRAISALCASELCALRYAGTDSKVIAKLRSRGCGHLCDETPEGQAWLNKISIPTKTAGPSIQPRTKTLGYSSTDPPRRPQLFSRARLSRTAFDGLESRCTVGWHGEGFRDYYRFSAPSSRPATIDYLTEYYGALGYAVSSASKLRFAHAARPLAKFIGASELRYARTIRAVVTADDAGASVVKLAYSIQSARGVRIINGSYSNMVEKEVLSLLAWCQWRHNNDQ